MNRYEELRVCALGHRARAVGMILFIQHGMSHWMHRLKNVDLPGKRSSQHTNEIPVDSRVAALLADAVLEFAGPVFCIKEKFNA